MNKCNSPEGFYQDSSVNISIPHKEASLLINRLLTDLGMAKAQIFLLKAALKDATTMRKEADAEVERLWGKILKKASPNKIIIPEEGNQN